MTPATGQAASRPNRGRRSREQGETDARTRGDQHGIHRAYRPPWSPRVLIVGSLVVTALTAATAAASAPTPMGVAAPAAGFLLDDGSYTPVAIPRRLAATAPQGIVPTGINDRRQIVGEYIDDRLVSRGFLLDKDGRFTRIDIPGALGTNAARINNRGQLLGGYLDDSGRSHGFVLERGRYTTFDVPGAQITFPLGLNDRGQIVGFGFDPADLTTIRGFLLAKGAKGPLTPINRPGATTTAPFGINNRGQIVGAAETPAATSSPQPTGMPPMGRMARPLTR
jgi:hypothetical protein